MTDYSSSSTGHSPPWPARLGRWFVSAVTRSAQNVATAFVQVWSHKGRSLLTTLGIIIAVTSIITVISFVEGFGNYVTDMLRGYGTKFIIVYPFDPDSRRGARGRWAKMDVSDIEAVRVECESIERISPLAYGKVNVSYGGEAITGIDMRGVNEHYQPIRSFSADLGRFLGPVDVENSARVCVLGRTLLKMLQCDESIVGESIYIQDRRFRVIGLLQSKGSFMGEDQDETVMVPYTTSLSMFPELRERMMFLGEASDETDLDEAEAQIRRVLRRRHNIQAGQPDDFYVSRQDQTLNELKYMRVVATSVLSGIVGISLLVGGIGVMNVMLVSITERTREIGLRKSVGGRRRDILLQFLTEAVVLSTIGGVAGVLLGYLITYVGSLHPSMIDISVPMWSVALALGFSAGTGIVFGIIPAFKAAIIHPIDALRHE